MEEDCIARNVKVVPYNPRWPEMFRSESIKIEQALGNNCSVVHHIGSTAIPGLSAKPIIDILPIVKDIVEVDAATKAMESLGYEAKGENGMAFRRFFQKGKEVRTHHVHVYEKEDPEIGRYLKFRDWMCSNKEDCQAYGALKLELASKFPQDIFQYCLGKDAFVAGIDAKDGYHGWRMVQPLTDREWEAVQRFRRGYFDETGKDATSLIGEQQAHIHFVYYLNSEIIGYVQFYLFSNRKAVLQVLYIDPCSRYQGKGSHFLILSEKWMKQNRVKFIQADELSADKGFWKKNGFASDGKVVSKAL